MMEDFGAFEGLHPQCVSRWKLNRRRLARLQTSSAAVIATIASAEICCQSMHAKIVAGLVGATGFPICCLTQRS
jgi:hypothetical protein